MTDSGSPTSAPRSLGQIKLKAQLQGKVSRVEMAGAFVDVGLEREGFVHLSALSKERVNRVEDLLQVGQAVTVWVQKVDPGAGRLELTLVKPLALQWDDLKKGMVVSGDVVRLEKFGAFVDIGAERPGLIHVSELAEGYVKDPAEVIHLGETVQVQILGVDRKKKQIQLSLKALETHVVEEAAETPEESPITAMQAAFLRAQEGGPKAAEVRPAGRQPRSSEDRKRREQEEILSRTLQSSTRKS